jgi:hypothetical protein
MPRTLTQGGARPSDPLSCAAMDHGALDDLTAKVSDHEAAAHQRSNWVRLTFDCNDRCIFCLDSHTHDGTIRAPAEVKSRS